jgi:3-methylcrotonyl-CoA carboxylase alpha subunit
MPPIQKVLIANRGEIAVRVARTCRVMGIATVAVYSEADAGALHTRVTDEAVAIGPAEAARSYLSFDAILDAARRSGADAVHPGYGFLSQNGDFADAVARAGLVFIGPPGDVHRKMGDKKGARRLMAAAGVPVVPGYDGDDQADATLARAAARIGWPVMIKPSRGGGGKGMRVVRSEKEFLPALASSRREARSAFGDEVMVLERLVERPRHVEVQVIGDGTGRLLHLLERECSIQRRHQKVVEETPSPALSPEQRTALCAAGVAAARAAGYVNAGTVEFLLEPSGHFYFLEMNTRLQVEHPVTECVTGLDLVRLQIEVASGRPLALTQEVVVARGHALECRLSAEDPRHGDLPSPGRILHFAPPDGPGVRFDGGIASGSEVTVHYDPLLGKIITWGATRAESIERMADALRRTVVLGVVTNLERLQAIVEHPAFRAGDLHTGFLEEHLAAVEPASCPPAEALAALGLALPQPGTAARSGAGAPRAADPWATLGPWRLG